MGKSSSMRLITIHIVCALVLCFCDSASSQFDGAAPPQPDSGVRFFSGLLNLSIPNYGMTSQSAFRQNDYGIGSAASNDVGENDGQNDGLWCQSASSVTDTGTWIQPDGTTVQDVDGRNIAFPVYVVQTQGQVGLLRPGGLSAPQANNALEGLFQCMIPDENGNSQTLVLWIGGNIAFTSITAATLFQALQFVPPSQPRDSNPPEYYLTFIVNDIPPTYVTCLKDGSAVNNDSVTREIVNALYLENGASTSVLVRLTLKTREAATYMCTVGFFKLQGVVSDTMISDPVQVTELSTSIDISVTEMPTGLTARRTGYTEVHLSWPSPVMNTPAVAGYEVFYTISDSTITQSGAIVTSPNTSVTLSTGLVPGNEYNFFVVAFSNQGNALPSERTETQTVILSVLQWNGGTMATTDTITLSWTAPEFTPSGYTLSSVCTQLCNGTQLPEKIFSSVPPSITATITELFPITQCNITLIAMYGNLNSNPFVLLANTRSPAPDGFSIMSMTNTSIIVSWVSLNNCSGIISGYTIQYTANGSSDSTFSNVDGIDSSQHTLNELAPCTNYSLKIAARTSLGDGVFSEAIEAMTGNCAMPASSSSSAAIAASVTIVLILIIIIVIVVVVLIVLLRKYPHIFSKSHKGSHLPTSSVHYTKEGIQKESKKLRAPVIEKFPSDMRVHEGQRVVLDVRISGDGALTYEWYHNNQLLENDYAYEIKKDGSLVLVTVEEKHKGRYRLVARSTTGVVERQLNLTVVPEDDEVAKPSFSATNLYDPIPVAKFGQFVSGNHASSNQGFRTIYNSLDSAESEHPVTVALTKVNKPFNRFANITAYDDNRVTLKPIQGFSNCQNDYINASFINGYNLEHKYIATQGPMEKTLVSFWRLVWQERPPTIVMVTNLKELNKVKCQQYWPEEGSQQHGPFCITLLDTQVFSDYTIRSLKVELDESSKPPLRVTQFQFTSWPDHGVPEYGSSLLGMRGRVKAFHNPKKGPMLVHCSAGVGRTGTYITIDIALEKCEQEKVLDVCGIIVSLRHQRMKMVQTLDQFVFICDTLLESVTCGDNQISAGNLRGQLSKYATVDPKTGRNTFQNQFAVLKQVTPDPADIKHDTANQYPSKNRSLEFAPYDKYRVPLKAESPDYIHATYVNGYKQKKAFIVTQSPMENTCRDFWKMIMDRSCSVIVMLCRIQEDEKEVCAQYWPVNAPIIFGEFRIDIKGEQKFHGFKQRELQVSRGNEKHTVIQFQITNWNQRGQCSDVQTIIKVQEEMYTVQRRTGNNPVVVHCSDTVSRSGMFCAIATVIDRCKTEGVVDVFQVIKTQRIQKPGMVTSVFQYQFIFEAVVAFFESFDSYSNFDNFTA